MTTTFASWPGALLAPEPIPATTTLGAVHLTVSDLDRSLAYWTTVIGLRAHALEGRTARLHAGGPDLIVLVEEPGAPTVRGHAGLFHVAILLPSRPDLARWLVHAARDRVHLEGLSDHLVSEAIYLRDPDHHGIEVYADRPRDTWPSDGLPSLPLDTDALFATLDGPPPESYAGMPDGTIVGHVHLHVGDLGDSARFYTAALGFDRTFEYESQASFYSAGEYHHHLGANLWAGRGVTQPPPGSAALRHYTIILPTAAERDRLVARAADAGADPVALEAGVLLHDPSGNPLLLAVTD